MLIILVNFTLTKLSATFQLNIWNFYASTGWDDKLVLK